MGISFGNLTTNNNQIIPELQKRIESQENFTAIDTEKLKQDTVELAKNAKDTAQTKVEENFIYKTLRNVFGIQDPKKFLISAGLMIATTLGFAALGNKFNKQIIDFSHNIDDIVKNAPIFKKIGNFTDGIKKNIGDFFNQFDWAKDIKETFAKRKSGPVLGMAKTIGPKGQMCYNVSDTAQAIHTNVNSGEAFKQAKKAFGGWFNPRSRSQALEFIKNTEIKDKATNEIFDEFKFNNEKINELVDEWIQTEDSFGIFGFFTKDKKIEAFAQKIAQENGLTSEQTSSLISKLQSISPQARMVKNLGNKIDAAETSKGNKALKEALEFLIGEDNKDFEYFRNNFMEINTDPDRGNFARKLTDAIINKHLKEGENLDDPKVINKILWELKEGTGRFAGEEAKDFLQITMNRESFIQRWAPVNGINLLGKKIFKDKWPKNFGKGNLGDALIKFNMADGRLASTTLGRLTQKIPLYTTESISNHVADLSTINLFITVPALLDLFNTVQEAPKEQKGATLADNFVGSLGQFVFSLPLASAITYGVATLKNLEKGGPLKWVGKIVGMGLPTLTKNGAIPEPKFIKRFAGGAFRFWAIMFLLSPKITSAIEKLVHKTFGKPYNKEEAEKAKQLEEQRKQMIPELGITQGELMDKMEKNPQAMQKLQSDAKLAYTIEQNPKLILDLLDGKEVQYIEPPKSPASQGVILSPANKDRLNNKTNMNSTNQNQVNSTNQITATDSATYIPSSAFVAPKTTMSAQQQGEYDAMMSKADKYLAAAEKYI